MKVVKYVLGVLFILGGIGALAQGAFGAGLLTAILGVLLLPPVSDALKEKFKFWQNKAVRYVSYIVLVGVIGALPKSPAEEMAKKVESRKKFVIEYIKKDTLDKSLQNARNLAETGELFKNYNYSFEHTKKHITEQYDSINKVFVVTFNPKFNFTDENKSSYILEDKTNGKLQDYVVKFSVNDNNEIVSKKTILTYSKAGEIEYDNSEVPELNSLIDEEVVNPIKEIKAMEKQILKQKEEHEKRVAEFVDKCLSSWDHSHRELVKLVKQNMNNPKSFEHVETRYGVTGDYAGIVMVYRDTNAFGAIVTNSIKAKVSLDDCSLISVEE